MPRRAPHPCSRCRVRLTREQFCDQCGSSGWSATVSTSRHERGYGSEWDRTTRRIRKRDKHLCQECLRNNIVTDCSGKYAGAVDHIIPKDWGGNDEDGNLELLCTDCHNTKTQRERRGMGGSNV